MPERIIQLVEYETKRLPANAFSETMARWLDSHHKGVVAVEPPTYKTDGKWELTPQGWVGFIPLPDGTGLALKPRVSLSNLFRMLEYAYDLESFQFHEGLYDAESLTDFYERLASLLCKRFLLRARNGLYRAYREEHEPLTFVRGRIDMQAMSRIPVVNAFVCDYEDFTADIEDNRILAWTFHTLLRSGLVGEERLPLVRKCERVLRGTVSLTPHFGTDCVKRQYSRLNEDYRVLHCICRFFLENSGPTQNLGDTAMVPFLVDMGRLFEKFVARWMQQNLPSEYWLSTQEATTIDDSGQLRMQMDLVLYWRDSRSPICVLDTKYKIHGYVKNDDYNQVVAYADTKGCSEAALVYPKPLPSALDVMPGKIHVRSLCFDVSQDIDQAGATFRQELLSMAQYR